ncbi:cell division protein ZipA [Lysobacter sp. TY2-98]|uniref:cell division protein ZipA n=1 Tax=Lysobacter sp. TY2-98 TaxID=2290922 RepID=UPI000E206A24|nr:cell division protein ZipA [Lysobacter sp. TY2-98]AXK71756.1 cell division protein ZipA [Lysobacter sp. TY2-98]
MSDMAMLRIWILVAGVVLVAAIIFFGRPKRPGQGRRVPRDGDGRRMEPTLGEQLAAELGADDASVEPTQESLDLEPRAAASSKDDLGKRTTDEFDKIVTLYLAARAGQLLSGSDIVVAAERAGLVFGHMGVFHRLVEGHPERGPVFSVANIMKPGSFDMANIQELKTPAIAFFLTLPAPVAALDAWDTMLPTAQRMAELLDAVVLDEQRNSIGRQRIAQIRDDLRAYDRQREAPPLTRPSRW